MLNWKTQKRPIVALAPMADMTDSAFCRVIRAVCLLQDEPTVVFREMVSAEAVVRGNLKTLGMIKIDDAERPVVQQIFGQKPDVMAKAAEIIVEQCRPDGIDINMGCPVYKLVHNFNGAALMNEPKLASEIVKAVKSAVCVPVSVKIRTGWNDPTQCLEFSKVLESAGADLISVHGRTKTQGYSGKSDWKRIGEVKQKVAIPLLANGDIHTPELTLEALELTGCDGVLIGRGALGNPWIFKQINEILSGIEPTKVGLEERVRIIKIHLDFHIEQYGERGIVTFRKHLSWYLRGIEGVKKFREKLILSKTKVEVLTVLDELLNEHLKN